LDGLFTFLIIIGIVNAIVKWARKQSADKQKSEGATPEKPWQRMLGDMAKTMEETMTGKAPAGTAPTAPVYKTLKAAVYNGEGTGGGEGETFSAGMNYQRPATISGFELASGRNPPSTEGTSLPQEPAPQWHGSLAGTEGSVAFTTNIQDTTITERVQETYPTLNLKFDRNSIMQAVVMQEILTRPQDRRRRWRPH
jgi:hypothetical protein